MSSVTRLGRKLTIFVLIGLVAFAIDSWAIANARSFLSLLEFGALVFWLGVIISGAFRGHLKAGPEEDETVRAIEMSSYQLFIALYLIVIAFIALIVSDGESILEYILSPFNIWLIATPLVAVGIALEIIAGGE